MKLMVVLCCFFFSTTWALPEFQHSVPLKRYSNPLVLRSLQDATPRIINGTEVVPNSIPYQAFLLLMSQSLDAWSCSGTLISPTHVLTSAHCLYNAAVAIVYLGAHDIYDDNQLTEYSATFIFHEEYRPEALINDIGVIILDVPVELNANITVATLPSRDTTIDYAGETARISGWGLVDGDDDISNILLQANVSVISNAECREVFAVVEDSQICSVGEEGQRFCDGDNGGPLVVGDTQIGIISFAANGCPSRYPQGYTRITSYLDWLEEATGLKF